MSRYQIDVLTRPEEFEALRDEWSELLAHSAADTIFLTWEWQHTWWRHLGAGRRLSLITVRAGRQLVAIAPLAQQSWRPAALQFVPQLELLGTGDVGSDYLDVIVRRDAEPGVTAALGEELAARRALVHLAQLNGHSAAARVAGLLKRRGWQLRVARTDVCPYIPLEGRTFEEYLSTLGASHRRNFSHQLRRLRREFDVRFRRVTSEDDRRAALATLIALHTERWEPRGGSTAFYAETLRAFHDEFTRLTLAAGWLRLYLLELDGRPAAALYGFAYRRKFFFYQAGFDPAFARYSVGVVTVGLTIGEAIAEGLAEYDLLHGDEPYKFLWARASRPIAGLDLYPPSMLGALSRASTQVYRAAKALGRRTSPGHPSSAHGEPDFVVPSSR